MKRRTIAELEAENARLREYIAAAKECAEARAAEALQADLDDLRARCSQSLKTLAADLTVDLGVCPFCGEMWPNGAAGVEERMELAAKHDNACPKNPIRIERDGLREALNDVRARIEAALDGEPKP